MMGSAAALERILMNIRKIPANVSNCSSRKLYQVDTTYKGDLL